MFDQLKENNIVNYEFHVQMLEKIKTMGFQNKEIEDNYDIFYQEFNQNNFMILWKMLDSMLDECKLKQEIEDKRVNYMMNTQQNIMKMRMRVHNDRKEERQK